MGSTDTGTAARRVFAVGDVHGCYRQLTRLLDRLPLHVGRDRIVFLGDYINRGPQSREVIDHLLRFEANIPGTVFLMGNHEQLLLEYARTGEVELLHVLRSMGIEATLASYDDAPVQRTGDLSFLPPHHRRFLERLRPSWRTECYWFVHAGIRPDGDRPRPSLDVRDPFLRSPPLGSGETVVFGHSMFATPFLSPGKIGINSGAGRGGLLTAVELPGLVFHHA